MEKNNFIDQGIIIRALEEKDLEKADSFMEFGNSLVDEDAPVVINSNIFLEEEKKWLESRLAETKKNNQVFFFAEKNGEVIGISNLSLLGGKRNHVASFGISIKNGYRGIGLGYQLMEDIIREAKEKMQSLKIIRLSVLSSNQSAINLYEKCGFKEAARVPEQILHKGELVDEVIMLLYV